MEEIRVSKKNKNKALSTQYIELIKKLVNE